jgi:hypothetical protein
MSIISAVAFCGFLALVLNVAASRIRRTTDPNTRQATNVLLIYALAVSFAAGISQRDMWPFSSWKMMVGLTPPATPTLPSLRVVGVQPNGSERNIDFRAWKPLSLEELYSWLQHDFFQLDLDSRDRVGAYLLSDMNTARLEALSAAGLPWSSPVLGRLSAPTHVLHPAIWDQRDVVPQESFVAVRIYKEAWDLQATTGVKASRTLAYEYPRP